jgi:LytS/YehU family sensor histidine kinase
VSLEEELEVLKVYIELEAMLLQSDFHYTITLDEKSDTSGITVPALLIQPYIENAFKHGLRHKIGRKELHLRILLDEAEEILTIEIQDNGIGRTASARINNENSPEHNSFATDAMEKRLELLNHDKKDLVGIEISDKFDSAGEAAGTTVTIRIHV